MQALVLPGDGAGDAPTLASHLDGAADPELAAILARIADAAIPLGERLALGGLPGDPTTIVGVNETGDEQKALDVGAHEHFIQALRSVSVRSVLSEEAEVPAELDPAGHFDVAMDPIDGSGSIGIGAQLGTLFAIFPAGGFLRRGRELVAAGYVSFGHTTDLCFSLGDGVTLATLDRRTTVFRIAHEKLRMPAETAVVSFNASNLQHYAPAYSRYVGDCLAGKAGPRKKTFNMRWVGAAVGELHRILLRGGLYMYPADTRPGYGSGNLRLVYEGFPIAYLMEQAGGAATDGATPMLDLVPSAVHAKTPLIFGSAGEVATLQDYLSRP